MTDLQTLVGMWAADTEPYLVNMFHPVMRNEWSQWWIEDGFYRYGNEGMERARRQFDRLMVVKYGEICPPPVKTKWQLWGYDIQDMNEDRLARQAAAQRRKETQEEVVTYVEEDY